MIALSVIMIFRYITNLLSFTALFLLVNHSTEPRFIGLGNGIAQSSASLARGIGPLVSGFMLSWSLSNDLHFPLNHYFSFFVFGFGFLFTLIISCLLPDSINVRKK